MIIFGPVPSRRLGRSIGINNIPPKVCSYSCIYCQLGRAMRMTDTPESFYSPDEIYGEMLLKLRKLKTKKEAIDYLTFVADGEPTLDCYMGEIIGKMKSFGYKIAVISNASQLWREDVREILLNTDLISVKVDAVEHDIWKKINRPYKTLDLSLILDGISEFAAMYKGKLITETMLIKDVNDSDAHIRQVASTLSKINPAIAYLSIPTRPPAESWVKPVGNNTLNRCYQLFDKKLSRVEYLIGYEGSAFSSSGNFTEDILSITSVHPMRKEAVEKLLQKDNENWQKVEQLLSDKRIIKTVFDGEVYFLRNLEHR